MGGRSCGRGLSGRSWSAVVWQSGEGGAEALPGGGDRGGPAPGGVDTQAELAGAAGDSGLSLDITGR